MSFTKSILLTMVTSASAVAFAGPITSGGDETSFTFARKELQGILSNQEVEDYLLFSALKNIRISYINEVKTYTLQTSWCSLEIGTNWVPYSDPDGISLLRLELEVGSCPIHFSRQEIYTASSANADIRAFTFKPNGHAIAYLKNDSCETTYKLVLGDDIENSIEMYSTDRSCSVARALRLSFRNGKESLHRNGIEYRREQ